MENQVSYEAAADTVLQASEHSAKSEERAAEAPAGPITWRDFYQLAKPGIIYSNSMTVFAGFWIASQWNVDWLLLIYTLVGAALVIGSGCVLNNYLDREMDAKMERTQHRALPSGKLTPNAVLAYGITLGVLGVAVLYLLAQSPLATLLAITGLFLYVWLYTAWFKRTSVWSTFMGSFSGAVPPMIGYCAVAGTIDLGAILLFLFLFLWQPPHFWALGIRRAEEYRAAGYPLLPVVKGSYVTKISMLRYIVLLVPVSVMLTAFGYVGPYFMILATALGLIWGLMCVSGFKAKDEIKWAKNTFLFSILYLTLLSIMMVVDTVPA